MMPGDHMKITAGYGDGSSNRNIFDLWTDPNPIVRGHTYSMKIDMNLSSDNSGYLHIWRDGVEIVNYNGPIGYGDATYWKEGIYRTNAAETMAVDYSNLKIVTPTLTQVLTIPGVTSDTGSGSGTSDRYKHRRHWHGSGWRGHWYRHKHRGHWHEFRYKHRRHWHGSGWRGHWYRHKHRGHWHEFRYKHRRHWHGSGWRGHWWYRRQAPAALGTGTSTGHTTTQPPSPGTGTSSGHNTWQPPSTVQILPRPPATRPLAQLPAEAQALTGTGTGRAWARASITMRRSGGPPHGTRSLRHQIAQRTQTPCWPI